MKLTIENIFKHYNIASKISPSSDSYVNLLFEYLKNCQIIMQENEQKFRAYLNYLGHFDYVFEEFHDDINKVVTLDKDLNLISYRVSEYYGGSFHTIYHYAFERMLLELLHAINPSNFENEYKEFYKKAMVIKSSSIVKHIANISSVNIEKASASIEPYLDIEYADSRHNIEDFNLSFKIKLNGVSYVIKKLVDFTHAIKKQEMYQHGAKINFIHAYDAFDDFSKEIIDIFLIVMFDYNDKNIKFKENADLFCQIVKICKNHYQKIDLSANVEKYHKKHQIKSIDYRLKKMVNISLFENKEIFEVTENILKFDKKIERSKNVNSGLYSANINLENGVFSIDKYSNKVVSLINMIQSYGPLQITEIRDQIYVDILPSIRRYTKVSDQFYEKLNLPEFSIKTKLYEDDGSICIEYDVKCEDSTNRFVDKTMQSYKKLVKEYGFVDGSITEIKDIYNFLTRDLEQFKRFGPVLVDEELKKMKVKRKVSIKLYVDYGVNMLDLKIENDNLTKSEIIDLVEAYKKQKDFFILEDKSIVKIDKNETKKLVDLLEDYQIDLKKEKDLIFSRPMNYLLKLVNQKDSFVELSDKVKEIVEDIINYPNNEFDYKIKNDLRTYQVDGFKWLKTLDKYNFGGILADDMGLGKTLQMITFIDSSELKRPTLIVSPSSLVYNWTNEIKKWSKMKYQEIIGPAPKRADIINSIDQNKKMIYVTSYDSLRQDVDLYDIEFAYVIIDEAQYIKNKFAKKSESVKKIKAINRFALTGTPIENSLSDLWSIFDFVMPNYLLSYNKFKDKYEKLIMGNDHEALNALVKRTTPFILRRTKEDSLLDLPEKIETTYQAKMGVNQRKLYDSYVLDLKEKLRTKPTNTKKIELLAYLTKLREICVHPSLINRDIIDSCKMDLLEDLLANLTNANHKVLIFSQFVSAFPYIEKILKRIGFKYFVLTGQTKSLERIRLADEFNEDDDVKVFLISLKAGGTGLNLTGADTVIHIDPWWNIASENQASDRAHRIGQNKRVTVIKLYVENTIEEKVIELQQKKKKLAESIIDGNKNEDFNVNDIKYLID